MSRRRLPLVVLLVGLLVAAVVAGNRKVTADAGVREPDIASAIPASNAQSSAWYCAGGPVGTGPSNDQVTISVVGPSAVRVAIDVMAANQPVAELALTVGAHRSTTLPVARYSHSPSAALVVQPLGPGVVVEQGFAQNGDIASAPCATRASSSWFFAAGSTVHGGQQWLSLFDPYAVDTVVDVQAFTENGLRSPEAFQDVSVPEHSRVMLRVDRAVAQEKIVAIAVKVRNGARIVATQSMLNPASATRTNASMSLGALAAGPTWMFADNRSRAGATEQLVIADPGQNDATVRVSVVNDRSSLITRRVVKVASDAAVAVDFSGSVPAGAAYTLVVQSPVPVVAETRDTFDPSRSELSGLVTELGSPSASSRWWFAGGPYTATGLGGGGVSVPAGAQLVVVMKVGASAGEIANMHNKLAADGHIDHFTTVTRADAKTAFISANRDNPALVAGTTTLTVSPSFIVSVKHQSDIDLVRRRVLSRLGVLQVVSEANAGPRVVDDVVVFNPGAHPVRVSLTASAGGSVLSGAGFDDLTIAPGRQATISLVTLTATNVAATITATGPVVAERFVLGLAGSTRSPGVPAP